MNSLLNVIAVVLIVGWLLSVFVYSATGLIHILLIAGLIALVVGLMRTPGTVL